MFIENLISFHTSGQPSLHLFLFRRVGGKMLVIKALRSTFEKEHEMRLLLVLQKRVFQINVSELDQHVNDACIFNILVLVKMLSNRLANVHFAIIHNVVNHQDARNLSIHNRMEKGKTVNIEKQAENERVGQWKKAETTPNVYYY